MSKDKEISYLMEWNICSDGGMKRINGQKMDSNGIPEHSEKGQEDKEFEGMDNLRWSTWRIN